MYAVKLYIVKLCSSKMVYNIGRQFVAKLCSLSIFKAVKCDPSARNQSHVGRVRFPLRPEMHGRAYITHSCIIAFLTFKICYLSYGQVSHMNDLFIYTNKGSI